MLCIHAYLFGYIQLYMPVIFKGMQSYDISHTMSQYTMFYYQEHGVPVSVSTAHT